MEYLVPAIHTARLKVQISNLFSQFNQPARFIHDLIELFDLYADRVYRAGQNIPPPSRIPAYHISPMVMLQLKANVRIECRAQPEIALTLVDALWLETKLEPRLLAAYMLGQIQLDSPEVVLGRLTIWSSSITDRLLLSALLSDGTDTLRHTAGQLWLETIQKWINSNVESQRSVGLQALLPLISDPADEHIPAVFSSISALLHSPPANLQTDLQDVLEACTRRSPGETGFFLRQLLSIAASPELIRLVRRIFPLLPPTSQDKLRALLQSG